MRSLLMHVQLGHARPGRWSSTDCPFVYCNGEDGRSQTPDVPSLGDQPHTIHPYSARYVGERLRAA